MANYSVLKAAVQAVIKTNGNQEITGANMQSTLISIINSLGTGYQFMGVATPSTSPGTPDYNVAYIGGAGTYANFGTSVTVPVGSIGVFKYNGSWAKEQIALFAGIDDVPTKNSNNLVKSGGVYPIDQKTTGLFNIISSFTASSVAGYTSLNGVGTIPKGVYIENNSDCSILTSEDTSLTNRQDILSGRTILTNSVKTNFQTLANGGNVSLTFYLPIDRETMGLYNIFNSYTANSVGSYTAIYNVGIIPKGIMVKNNSECSILVSEDISLTNRQDIPINGSVVTNSVKTYFQTLENGGNVSLDFYIQNINSPIIEARLEALEANNSVSTGKIQDNAVTLAKLGEGAAEEVTPKNLINKAEYEEGYYYGSYGKAENSDYFITGIIPVTPNTKYCISGSSPRMIAFLASSTDTIPVEAPEYPTNPITIPSTANYAIVTFLTRWIENDIQMEKGEQTTAYEPYFTPYRQLYLRDGQVTMDKLADDFTMNYPSFGRLYAESASLAVSDSLTINKIHISKDFVVSTKISGTIGSILVGFAYLGFYGRWIEITPTQLIVKAGTSGAVQNTYTHGLTLDTNTTFLIDRDTSNARLTLINGTGQKFEQETSWSVNSGEIFVYNGNTSGSVGVSLSFFPKDISSKIWMFGDSYFSYNDPARWVYYILNWGYTKPLIDAMGGENSTAALSDFDTLLQTGAIPVYALWALGMNDGADTSTAPNATWLANTQTFISKCEQKGIIPVLCTIPTIPSKDNSKKSQWVRNSGYRYVDMAKAVEEENTTYWKWWGTDNAFLSSDETHPTAKGAIALASQAMIDFPEISVL